MCQHALSNSFLPGSLGIVLFPSKMFGAASTMSNKFPSPRLIVLLILTAATGAAGNDKCYIQTLHLQPVVKALDISV